MPGARCRCSGSPPRRVQRRRGGCRAEFRCRGAGPHRSPTEPIEP
ncbi:hypothetical protein F8B43_0512 [Methylorubrum populi]|uniref:Uncharacterized protein n=1 Tax=Methylorubrum populi TaxID=223967 RepID=A0A833N4M2_9HYPH|nr:hypothetical protein F8B43_0512 [Methylorubrum populi]